MFEKKVLSFIALFIGSSIPFVTATAEVLNNCSLIGSETTCEGGVVTSYCINSSQIIGTGTGCKTDALGAGVFVFEKGTGNDADKIFKREIGDTIVDATKLSIYNCDNVGCVATDGYVTSANGIYSVLTASNKNSSSATSLKLTSVSDATGCTTATIGKYYENSGYFLCIGEERSVKIDTNSKEYLMLGTGVSETPFETRTNIVIKSGVNYVIFDNQYQPKDAQGGYDSKGVYCVYDTNELISRNTNYCEGTILNKLYTCGDKTGICTEEDADVEGSIYPYIIKNSVGQNYHLYLFTVDGTSHKLTIAKRTNDNGIFAYAKSNPEDQTYGTPVSQYNKDTLDAYTYLYYCKNSECILAKGYIMHGATTGSEKLAYCDSSSPCSDIADTAHNVCATAGTDEGKVILVDHDSNASNAKAFQMCTAVNSDLTTLAASKNYFVLNGDSNKYTEYIVGVNTVGQATLDDGYYLIDNNNILITETASGNKLIKCSSNGIDCTEKTSPTGIFINTAGNGLITCTNSSPRCSLDTTITDGYYVNADSQLVSCSSNVCTVVAAEATSYYLNISNKLIYCESSSNCSEPDIVIGLYKTATPSVNIIKCENTTSCSTVTIAELSETICTTGKEGQLSTDGKLCLNGSPAITKTFGDIGNWVVSQHDSGIFKTKITTGSYGVIEISNTKIVLATTNTGNKYYCKNSSTFEVTVNGGSCPDGTITIEHCDADGVCNDTVECNISTGAGCDDGKYNLKESKVYYCDKTRANGNKCQDVETIGYFVNYEGGNVKNAFKCPTKSTCVEYTVTAISCTNENIGLIYKTGESGSEVVHLCLHHDGVSTASVAKMTDNDAGNYMLSYHNTNNVFGLSGSTEYAMVSVTKNFIKLNTSYTSTLKYVYTDSSYKVKIRGQGTCDSATIIEFDYKTNHNGICTKN